MFQEKIGLRIKEIRKKNNLSQLEASHKSNINKSYWNDIENGKVNISILKLKDICDSFNLSLKDFFNNDIFKESNGKRKSTTIK